MDTLVKDTPVKFSANQTVLQSCDDCYWHLQSAHSIANELNTGVDENIYTRLYNHFTEINTYATAANKRILDRLVQTLAAYTRHLAGKPQLHSEDITLLTHTLELCLQCHGGLCDEHCPEKRFDKIWPLIEEMRQQIDQ